MVNGTSLHWHVKSLFFISISARSFSSIFTDGSDIHNMTRGKEPDLENIGI